MPLSGILALSALHSYLQPARPNVVIILTNDMGYADPQAFRDSEIPTPNIDRLCREGMKFTNFHATEPICVASRMGLLTCRYQARFGIYDNVYTPEENQLWVKETTLADVLRTNG